MVCDCGCVSTPHTPLESERSKRPIPSQTNIVRRLRPAAQSLSLFYRPRRNVQGYTSWGVAWQHILLLPPLPPSLVAQRTAMLGHMRQCLVPLLVVLAGAPWRSTAEHAHVFPGTGIFEPEVRASVAAVHAAQLGGGGGGGGVGAPLDIRVAKARGDRGYNAVRLSVVGHAAMGPGATITGSRAAEPVPFSHDAPFVHRWFASFDLGTPAKSCSRSSRYNTRCVPPPPPLPEPRADSQPPLPSSSSASIIMGFICE